MAPTIIRNPKVDSELMTDEIFGPVLPVMSVNNIDEAIDFLYAFSPLLAVLSPYFLLLALLAHLLWLCIHSPVILKLENMFCPKQDQVSFSCLYLVFVLAIRYTCICTIFIDVAIFRSCIGE